MFDESEMNLYSDFDNIVSLLLNLHERKLGSIDPRVSLYLDSANFLKEFGTVKVDIGRQSGKTEYILRHAQQNDLIIGNNLSYAKHLRSRAANNPLVLSANQDIETLTRGRKFVTIWVDEWITIRKKDTFYQTMARVNPKRIIIFGGE